MEQSRNGWIFTDHQLYNIKEKIESKKRLNEEDARILYHTNDLLGVGYLADIVRKRRYGWKAFYVHNQHLNYTNVCINQCLFCAYSKKDQDSGAFTLSIEEVKQQLIERIDEPIREIHVVGGLNPALPLSYYIDVLKAIKEIRPQATIKAFTAVEIDYISKISGYSLEDTINLLKEAGLSMLPGGGAEILNHRIHQKLFPKKINSTRWLEVMEAVHRSGITSNATMLYGHIETIDERIHHLIQLRELQDRTGGFSAFIPLSFHSKFTKLSHLPPTTAYDDLKTIAIARLMLDNFDHIKAYWVMIGEKLAQVALSFGADDLDGTIQEEKITHSAGATSAKGLTKKKMEHLIQSAGFQPFERDSFYHIVEPTFS